MIMWPSVMPQYLNVDGYQEQLGNMALRSSIDASIQKVRRRFTAAPRPLSAQLLITPEQLIFFRYWYSNVLLGGALRFGWVDPWSNLVLTNLMTNGGFETGTTGWVPHNSTIASVPGGVYGNCLEVTRVDFTEQAIMYTLGTPLVAGRTYTFSGYVKSGTAGDHDFMFYLYETQWGDNHTLRLASSSDWVNHTIQFIVIGAVATLCVDKVGADEGTMLFDEITLYDITENIVEMRFVESPSWSTKDGLNVTLNMTLEILP